MEEFTHAMQVQAYYTVNALMFDKNETMLVSHFLCPIYIFFVATKKNTSQPTMEHWQPQSFVVLLDNMALRVCDHCDGVTGTNGLVCLPPFVFPFISPSSFLSVSFVHTSILFFFVVRALSQNMGFQMDMHIHK